MIGLGQLEVAPKRTEAIKELSYPSYPTEASQMKSFLGSCNVYPGFNPNFAKLAGPLTQNFSKGGPMRLELDDSEKEQMNTLEGG